MPGVSEQTRWHFDTRLVKVLNLIKGYNINFEDAGIFGSYAREDIPVMFASKKPALGKWDQSFQEHYSIVAVDGEITIGFGGIDKTGYPGRLYVHKDYQGKDVATAVCNKLEQAAHGKVVTHASVMAKHFFKKEVMKLLRNNKWNGREFTLQIMLWKKQ